MFHFFLTTVFLIKSSNHNVLPVIHTFIKVSKTCPWYFKPMMNRFKWITTSVVEFRGIIVQFCKIAGTVLLQWHKFYEKKGNNLRHIDLQSKTNNSSECRKVLKYVCTFKQYSCVFVETEFYLGLYTCRQVVQVL